MKYILSAFALVCAVLLSGAALAKDAHQMPGNQMDTSPVGHSEVTMEYMRAMDAMHGPMMQGITDPDPDAAFVRGMLPHHEGAVEMAKIQLKYGKDPELRKMAQEIIDAQEKEISFMEDWLKKHGKKP